MPTQVNINAVNPDLLAFTQGVHQTLTSPTVKTVLYDIKSTADNIAEKSKNTFHSLEDYLKNASIDSLIDRVYAVGTTGERIFNILGCIPFIGSSSGGLRIGVGHLQVLGGAALAALGEIGVFLCRLRQEDEALVLKWKQVSVLGAEQILHGCLNILRGHLEVALGYYSLGLANVILLMPNVYKQDAFSPYFAYGSLKFDSAWTNKSSAASDSSFSSRRSAASSEMGRFNPFDEEELLVSLSKESDELEQSKRMEGILLSQEKELDSDLAEETILHHPPSSN